MFFDIKAFGIDSGKEDHGTWSTLSLGQQMWELIHSFKAQGQPNSSSWALLPALPSL